MSTKFPKPWRMERRYGGWRVYDANDRQLFVISGDQSDNPADITVLDNGTDDQVNSLVDEIGRMLTRR